MDENGTVVGTSDPNAPPGVSIALRTRTWYDVLGRLELEASYGYGNSADWSLSGRPTPRPSVTGSTVLVKKWSYPETLSDGTRRWNTLSEVDGQVVGSEFDALGRVVRSWRRPAASNAYRVTLQSYDALGHGIEETVYQNALASSSWPNEPPALSFSGPYSQTAYDWGLVREEGGEEWCRNLLTSTNLLAGVRRPDPETGEPVSERVLRYAYNAQGEVRAVFEGLGSETIGRRIFRDALGRKVREEVGAGSLPYGADALEWEYDPLGRLARARSRRASSLLNELAWAYDAWGGVVTLRREEGGEVTGASPGVGYEYEGPWYVEEGSARHPIVRRPRYVRLLRAPEGGGEAEVFASAYVDYGAPGSVSAVLGRPAWEAAAFSGGEESSWTEAWRVQETHLGARRWVKGEYERKAGGAWTRELTEEIPKAYEDPYDGLDRFGRPKTFRASHGEGEVPLRRTYSYSSTSGRLSTTYDYKTEGGTQSTLARDSYGYDAYGRLRTYSHTPYASGGGPSISQTWTLDAAGNWTHFSEDGVPSPSREYDRRNEIEKIGGDGGAVEYDEAGRIAEHRWGPHGVDARFLYDAWDRLVRYEPQGSATAVEFEYDALGRLAARVERDAGTGEVVEKKLSYSDATGRRAFRAAGDGAHPDRVYVFSLGSGRPWCLLGSASYYLADPWGQPAGLTTDAGATRRRFWYDGTGKPFLDYEDPTANDLWPAGAYYEGAIRALLPPFGGWISAVLGEELAPETERSDVTGCAQENARLPDTGSCEDCLTRAFLDPRIQAENEYLRDLGCHADVRCWGCQSGIPGFRGAQTEDLKGNVCPVRMCVECWEVGEEQFTLTLLHELVHCQQKCAGGRERDCLDLLCREIEAQSVVGFYSPHGKTKGEACRGAALSVANNRLCTGSLEPEPGVGMPSLLDAALRLLEALCIEKFYDLCSGGAV